MTASGHADPAAVKATPLLLTERLILRPLDEADAPAIQACFPRWEIVRFLLAKVPWPYPPDGALTFVREVALPAMEAGREWNWTLRLRTAPETLVGLIGLRDGAGDHRGFWLVPEAQGQGLMSEACMAVTEFWFEALNRPVLRVTKAVANEASRAVSRRAGMRVVGVTEQAYVSGVQPCEIWEITASEWRARRRAGRQD